MRKYHEENREKQRAAVKKYREENKEKIREKAREYNKRPDVKKSKREYARKLYWKLKENKK